MTHALALRTTSLLFALLLLAGCGQKGPLRLPDEPAASNSQESTQSSVQQNTQEQAQ